MQQNTGELTGTSIAVGFLVKHLSIPTPCSYSSSCAASQEDRRMCYSIRVWGAWITVRWEMWCWRHLQDPCSQRAPLAGDNICTASPGNPSACQCPLLLCVSYMRCKYYCSCLLSTAPSLAQQGLPAWFSDMCSVKAEERLCLCTAAKVYK